MKVLDFSFSPPARRLPIGSANNDNCSPAGALPVFTQDKGTVDPKIEQQIRALNEEWDKAFNRNDANAMGTFYTDDAVIISPYEGTFTGRKGIVEKKLKALDFDEDHCSNMATTITQLTMGGNEIHEIGEWSCTWKTDSGNAGQSNGHFSSVLVKDGDTWKIRQNSYDKSSVKA